MAGPSDAQLRDALSRYDLALSTRSKAHQSSADLRALDRWYRTTLRESVVGRKDKHLTVEELGRLMDWKLAHGKWRPKLQQMARSNPSALVKETTSRASTLDPPAALNELCKLKAVGPATASAILALWNASSQPFLSDEAYECMGLGKPDYKPACWARLVEAMQARVKKGKWGTVEELEKACWAFGVEKKYGRGGSKEEVLERREEAGLNEAKRLAEEGGGKTKVVAKKRGAKELKETVAKAPQGEDEKSQEGTRRSKRVKRE